MTIFKISLFAVTAMLSSNVFAATGTGHAQTELSNPLGFQHIQDVNLGTISIDPGAGEQTAHLFYAQAFICPASYVCSGSALGVTRITGMPNQTVYGSVDGSSAVLSNGAGGTVVFTPNFAQDVYTSSVVLDGSGEYMVVVGGSITFSGNEEAGTYSSRNTGGSGFVFTMTY